MWWKRVLIIVGLVIVGLIVALYVFLSIYDFNRFKPTIAQLVKKATGRDLRLNGDIEFKVGFPLGVSVEDVGFQNAPWGSRPELAHVKRVDVQVAILPLFRKIVEIKRLILIEPDILVETDSSGRSNFEFKTPEKLKPEEPEQEAPAEDEGIFSVLIFKEVQVRTGLFTYKSGQSNKTYAVSLDRLTITALGYNSQMELDLKGAFNGRPFEVTATFGPLVALANPDREWPVDLTGKVHGTIFTVKGAIRDLEKLKGLAFTIKAEGQSIPDIAELAGVTGVPDLGPFRLAAKVGDPTGKLSIEDVDFHAGTEELVEVKLTGAIKDLRVQQGIDMSFTVQGNDLASLERLVGRPLPIEGPFVVSGHVADPADRTYKIADLKVGLGENDLGGWVEVSLAGERPRLRAALSSEKLDVRSLLPESDRKPSTGAEPAKSEEKPEKVPPYETPSVDALRAFDVGIELRAGKILLPWATLSNLAVDMMLEDGQITVAAKGESIPNMDKVAERQVVVPFRLAAKASARTDVLTLEEVDLQAGTRDLVKLRLTGAIHDVLAQQGLDLNFTVQGKDLANLEGLVGRPLPIKGPFIVSSHVVDPVPKTYRFTDLKVVLGENDLGGRVELNLAGRRPRVTAALSSKRFDVRPFLEKTDTKATTAKEPPQSEGKATKAPSDEFSSLGALMALDADLKLQAGEILLPWATLNNLALDMTLQEGRITLGAKGQSIPDIAKQATVKGGPLVVPFKLAAKASAHTAKLGLEELDLQAGTDELAEVRLKGAIRDVLTQQGIDLSFTVQGKDLANLEKLLGRPLPIEGPFVVSGHIVDPAAKTYRFTDVKVGLGENDLGGWVEVGLAAERPRVTADLSSKRFDVRPIIEKAGAKSTTTKEPAESKAKPDKASPEESSSLDALMAVDADLKLQAGEILLPWATLNNLALDMTLQEGRITLAAQGQSIPKIGKLAKVKDEPVVVPFKVAGKLASAAGKLSIEKLDLHAGTEDLVDVRLKGAVEDLLAQQGIDVSFDIQGKDLANLDRAVGRQLPFKGAFQVSAHVVDPEAGTYKFSDLEAHFGNNDLAGWVHVDLTGQRPRVTATISAGSFDVRPLLEKADEKTTAEAESAEPAKERERVFPDKPLSLDGLKALDARVKLQAGQVLLPRLSVNDLDVDVMLDDGHLVVDPFTCVVGGGAVDGRFEVGPQGEAVALATELHIIHLHLGAMLEELGIEPYIEGKLGAEIDFHCQGSSVAALMAGLNGRLLVIMGEGRMNNRYIDLLGADLFRQVFNLVQPLSPKEQYSEVNCFLNHFEIKDGLASASALLLDTKHTNVAGGGEIDLRTEELNLAFKLSPKRSVGLSLGELAKSFRLSGTLAKPALAINPRGAMVTIGKALGGMALLGPAGILVPFIDVSLGDNDPCLKAIAAAQKEIEGTEGQKPSEEATDKTKGEKKGPLRLLKKLFGK